MVVSVALSAQILLPILVDDWVRKNFLFCLTDVLGESRAHLSALDTDISNFMTLGLQPKKVQAETSLILIPET